jgi:hypothetical protein
VRHVRTKGRAHHNVPRARVPRGIIG